MGGSMNQGVDERMNQTRAQFHPKFHKHSPNTNKVRKGTDLNKTKRKKQ